MPEGRESPPPETQTGPQLKETPGSGKGVDNAEDQERANKVARDNLESNPKGPLDDAVKAKFSKTVP